MEAAIRFGWCFLLACGAIAVLSAGMLKATDLLDRANHCEDEDEEPTGIGA